MQTNLQRKLDNFLEKLICIGNCNCFLLLREYLKMVVNVLRSSPKISDLIKNNFL